MIIEDGDKKHYVAIKSLGRLLSKMNSKHNPSQHFCSNCLQGFSDERSRNEHYEYCRSNESVRIEMPTRNPIAEYSKGQHQFKVPFIVYADFESILEPIQGVSNDPNQSSTRGVNAHKPSGWCLHSKFAYGKVKKPSKQYRGPDCVEKFCKTIISEAKRLYKSFPEKTMIPLTKEQLKEHRNATKCHICFKKFGDKGKVRDHCHYTGLYRGATHFACNLGYKVPSYIPVVFHNLAGYDAHLFIRELAKYTEDMGVIAKSVEDYISFSIKVEVDKYIDKEGNEKYKEIELRFIDSFKFMSSSLDSLVNNLAKGDHIFWGFEEYSDKQRELLIRKGIYPYEYMSSWDKFNEDRLPSKDKFYSNLNMSGVNDKEYEHARNVWKEFGIKNMGEYHDLYLNTDVILLANVFESFRSVCMKNYGLDTAHFYTAPGLAWKACSKKTAVRLELLLDPEMFLMFERGIRGGITQSVHRWAAANNPYMEEYDSNKLINYLQYLDANNLYGWTMSQPLPNGGFKWINCGNVNPKSLVDKYATEKDHGYLLEVDVSYLKELHNLHNDIPFMCTKMKVNGVEKLITNLYYKRKYIIHIRALKQALDHGLMLEKIHRCIKFKQSPWMKEYIDFNTRLRTAAENDFEKDFYKLMNNSVFRKTMENIRRHRNIKLVNNKEEYLKTVMKPNFKSGTLLGPDLMGCEMGKVKVVMNKPVYLGQAILDLSKIIMYEFHYDYMLPKYGNNIKLCYMDTDSFVYDIKTEDFYKDIAGDVEARFDTSGYCDRPLPVGKNKKIIGLMKDELGGEVMKEFVSLRPKMYSYRVGNSESKKCKGIKKCLVKKMITFEDYEKCLFEGRNVYKSQLLFRSDKHEVKTLEVNKLALNSQDDKRLSIDGIASYAMGHHKVWGME